MKKILYYENNKIARHTHDRETWELRVRKKEL